MNIEEIRELAKIVKENGLTNLEITDGDTAATIRIERYPNAMSAAQPAVIGGAEEAAVVYTQEKPGSDIKETVVQPEGTDVLSPTVGVFYSAPSPDSEEYVKVGSKVKKGDVLCIIEAMKLMNEITAEIDGTVAQVYIGNGQVVEYDQPLFRIV